MGYVRKQAEAASIPLHKTVACENPPWHPLCDLLIVLKLALVS